MAKIKTFDLFAATTDGVQTKFTVKAVDLNTAVAHVQGLVPAATSVVEKKTFLAQIKADAKKVATALKLAEKKVKEIVA